MPPVIKDSQLNSALLLAVKRTVATALEPSSLQVGKKNYHMK